jgi:hypothetical protein
VIKISDIVIVSRDKSEATEPDTGPRKMVYSIMKRFTIYQDDDGQWVAECEELAGYRATGATSEEAIEKMKSALLMFYPCRCED